MNVYTMVYYTLHYRFDCSFPPKLHFIVYPVRVLSALNAFSFFQNCLLENGLWRYKRCLKMFFFTEMLLLCLSKSKKFTNLFRNNVKGFSKRNLLAGACLVI